MTRPFETPAADLRRLVVLSTPYKPSAHPVAREMVERATSRGIEVETDLEAAKDLGTLAEGADLVISVGGDGTILATARRMVRDPVPTIGVNIGKLGFLAEFTPDDAFAYLGGEPPEGWRIVPRMMLRSAVGGGVPGGNPPEEEPRTARALNDVVIAQGPMTRLLQMDMWVDGRHATQYHADGLIISSPVGSTAYSLSLGGPILAHGLQALVVTPLAPHTLTNRPIVIDGSSVLDFRIRTETEELAVIFDGQDRVDLAADATLRVERAATRFPLITNAGRYSYYDILRAKLQWGTDPRGFASRLPADD